MTMPYAAKGATGVAVLNLIGWALHNQFGELVEDFKTKAEALEGGVLEKLVGEGAVPIHREDGRIEEERTLLDPIIRVTRQAKED